MKDHDQTDERSTEEKPAQTRHSKASERIDYSRFYLPQDIVMLMIGRWAMPTTVILVIITCLSGYFLDVQAFTPVVGMIAPVVMALTMVIKETSGNKESHSDKHHQSEDVQHQAKNERINQFEMEKEDKLAQMAYEQQRHAQEMAEKARQFDVSQATTRDFVDMAKDMNHQMADVVKKETELLVNGTHFRVTNDDTTVIDSHGHEDALNPRNSNDKLSE